jgi:hypothetical protein
MAIKTERITGTYSGRGTVTDKGRCFNEPLPWMPVKCPLTMVGWGHLDELFSSVQRDKTPK